MMDLPIKFADMMIDPKCIPDVPPNPYSTGHIFNIPVTLIATGEAAVLTISTSTLKRLVSMRDEPWMFGGVRFLDVVEEAV